MPTTPTKISNAMATIIILEHQMQKDFNHPYMVYLLAERWRADGHRVLIHHGTGEPPNGDIAIVNIDLTIVPDAYISLFKRYPVVVNNAPTNISKRGFSQLVVEPNSDWEGPVIVKTNANFGGRIDQRLRQRAARAGQVADIPPGPALKDYPILQSIAEVAPAIWENEGLIVEKFLPEQDADGYYMRAWVFFGEKDRSFRDRAEVPVIKSHHILERQPIEVPAEIRTWRERLGFDFGKFDYVVVDGAPILLDTNRTPGAPTKLLADPAMRASLDNFAAGLYSFLK